MPNNYFRFKQFTVQQEQAPFKVGTDGVLLGAWVNCKNIHYVLDVGTGTGLIALMLAQRCNASIDAIEPNKTAFKQACENIQNSPWKERINVINQSIQHFSERCAQKHYDLIVCNPPYFNRSLKNQDADLSMARHNDSLTGYDLLFSASQLLNDKGKLAVIYPASFAETWKSMASSYSLYTKRKLWIKPGTDKGANRVMLEMTRCPEEGLGQELSLREAGPNQYTQEYKALTRHFYLHF